MKTAALVVLSGRTAWRDTFPQDHKIGSLNDACRLVLTFTRADISPVVCVLDPGHTALERELGKLGAFLLKSPRVDAEMLENIQMGMGYLRDKCSRVFVTPVDIPLVTADTLRLLMDSPHAWTIPTHRGQNGHPVLVGRELFGGILSYQGEGGLRGALGSVGGQPHRLEVPDTGVVLDVERSTGLEDAAKSHDLWQMRPDIRVCICREQAFWGPGTRQLLSLIGHLGSVRDASEKMGMSYSKAWKLLKVLEQQLGFSVVSRQQGGKYGGEARLTRQGRQILERFTAYEQECRAAAKEIFRRHFPEETETQQ